MQLISNAGYHDEIAAVPSACQQLEVFTRVLTTLLNKMIDAANDDDFKKHLHTMLVSFPSIPLNFSLSDILWMLSEVSNRNPCSN